jgi:hypothetical protein
MGMSVITAFLCHELRDRFLPEMLLGVTADRERHTPKGAACRKGMPLPRDFCRLSVLVRIGSIRG